MRTRLLAAFTVAVFALPLVPAHAAPQHKCDKAAGAEHKCDKAAGVGHHCDEVAGAERKCDDDRKG